MKRSLAVFFLAASLVATHAEDAAPAKKVPDFVPFVVDRSRMRRRGRI
jgi:hypothetical protein